jgi:UPF0042 nucleotide-binding protein
MSQRQDKPRLLLVTGMSGAGKSTVLDALEDMGWDIVDNLPADLLDGFVNGGQECRIAPAAVAMDVRSRGFDPDTLPDTLHAITGVNAEILFLDCGDSELLRRYSTTRRLHPLAPDRPAEDGIARERRLMGPLCEGADYLIDTSGLSPVDLREKLVSRIGAIHSEPVLTIASFGFSRGVSRTADLVFDVRFLPNPHWQDGLRPLTGKDQAIVDYLAADEAWEPMLERTVSLLKDWIPRYWAAGKHYVTVAFGCTGGRHRSVATAEAVAECLREAGFSPNIRHRDIDRGHQAKAAGDPGKDSEAA